MDARGLCLGPSVLNCEQRRQPVGAQQGLWRLGLQGVSAEEPVRQPREMWKTTFRWLNSWQVHGERPHRCLWVELAPVTSWLGLSLCFQVPGDNQRAEQSRHTAVFRTHLPSATLH